ncbi:hypothetical protein BDZ89DRAFT_1057134 [Hymenopellis radicata]|nr:hypothetical protein BDZ89DRAFT_1057134 [Hymenopellis radicata]
MICPTIRTAFHEENLQPKLSEREKVAAEPSTAFHSHLFKAVSSDGVAICVVSLVLINLLVTMGQYSGDTCQHNASAVIQIPSKCVC